MNAISVSLYDKFDDLAILVDVIRHNWEGEYYISVCSNHPDAEAKIADLDLDIDTFTHGTQISYEPEEMTGLRERVNFVCRVYDTIRNAATGALENSDVEYVMHVNADAWPLSESRFTDLIDQMNHRDKHVAFKGDGLGYRDPFPIGHIMDQFFVLDRDFAVERDFFEHSPLELIPDREIHTILPILLLGKVGWSNVYFYSDQTEEVMWDNEPTSGARPMRYNPNWKFLHVAKEDFPADLGKSIQALHLKQNGLTDGEYISSLISSHYLTETELIAELSKREEMYNDRLRKFGLKSAMFERNFSNIEEFLDLKLHRQIQFLTTRAIVRLSDGIAKRARERFSEFPIADPIRDSSSERELANIYRSALKERDYPPPYDEQWFRSDDDSD